MEKDQIISSVQAIYASTNGDSIYAVELVNDKKTTVEYTVRRMVRDDLAEDSINVAIASLDEAKAELIARKQEIESSNL